MRAESTQFGKAKRFGSISRLSLAENNPEPRSQHSFKREKACSMEI